MSALFRTRALEQVDEGAERADFLRISPSWTRWAYWVVIAGAVAGVAYVGLAHVDEWAQGPGLIQVDGVTELTAKGAGTVATIAVEPGDQVEAGALLATLTSDNERAQLERLEHEFNLQLTRTLRDPSDQAARQSLVSLRVDRDLARERLDDMSLRAETAGIVEDIRVRPGQALAPGDQILTLSGSDRKCTVWALLPGRYRPELELGAEVRFNVSGYRYAQSGTKLSSVGAHVLGPREVGRYLGNEVAGSLELQPATVIAKAELESCSFVSDEQSYRFHQGMGGTSEVRLHSEPLWAVLFPNLRKVFRWLE
ncbi:MAG TPA: HlyD family efflux transporter periplasmic adaptor subunit [Polyangiales bacterium]|nr:HlyD family efflux transporter periplasmic adaptor subunit [Polyangiales bacterium]